MSGKKWSGYLMLAGGIALVFFAIWGGSWRGEERRMVVRMPGGFGPSDYVRVQREGARPMILLLAGGIALLVAGGIFAWKRHPHAEGDFDLEMRKLDTLYKDGILSQAEFQAGKAAILQRLGKERDKKG